MRLVVCVLKRLFHDKRLTVCVLVVWLALVCLIFHGLGAFRGQFMTFGPSGATEFMSMRIDTWPKWYALALFSFCNTTINEFIGSALVPWLTNTIQDQKTRYLDHGKGTCMAISLTFDVYTHIMSIFGLHLMFSQVDFLAICMVADCIVTTFTTAEWIRNKRVDKVRLFLLTSLGLEALVDARCSQERHELEGGLVCSAWVDPPAIGAAKAVELVVERAGQCVGAGALPSVLKRIEEGNEDKAMLLEGGEPGGR